MNPRDVRAKVFAWMGSAGRFARARPWWVAGATVTVLVSLLAWVLWPTTPQQPAPRERQYLEFTACLLTDANGMTGSVAAPVWAGMQDASLATHAKVQFLPVMGPQTAQNATLFATSLAQGGCRLIFAAGQTPSLGVTETAPHFPLVTFYLVHAQPISQPNVSRVDADNDAAVRAQVSRLITEAVAQSTR